MGVWWQVWIQRCGYRGVDGGSVEVCVNGGVDGGVEEGGEAGAEAGAEAGVEGGMKVGVKAGVKSRRGAARADLISAHLLRLLQRDALRLDVLGHEVVPGKDQRIRIGMGWS